MIRKTIHTCAYRLLRTFALLAVLMTAACADRLDDIDTPSTGLPDVEPGSIVLSLAGLPATRAISEYTEGDVERLDVLIFLESDDKSDPHCVYHRRFRRGPGTGTGSTVAADLLTTTDGDYTHYAVLGNKADFEPEKDYYVYVLANTHADKPEEAETVTQTPMQKKLDDLFPLSDNTDGTGCSHDNPKGTLSSLKHFVYTTRNIHLSGNPDNKPDVFLMDGMAKETTEETVKTVVLNDNDLLNPYKLYATLSRAAAKVTVTLTADPENHTVMLPEPAWVPNQSSLGTEVNPAEGQARYEWQNVNQREDTYLVTPDNYGTEGNEANDFPADADLQTHNSPTAYTVEVKSGREGTFKATTYSYSHYWGNTSSTYENASYLTVRVPLIYCAEGIPADFKYDDTEHVKWTAETSAAGETSSRYTATIYVTSEGKITDATTADGTERTVHYYVANYYKIPMGKDGRMDRNTHYHVSGSLTRPGSTTADKPLELPEVSFQVMDWSTEPISAGGDQNVHYLLVNKPEYTIRNVDSDNTLIYSSSHPVTVKVKRVWYINKKGDPVELMNTTDNTFVTSVKVENNDGQEVDKTYTGDEIPNVSANWDEEKLVGPIDLHSNNPVNNLVRHIELEVTNTAGDHAKVIIHQYPLDYIQFTEGTYSFFTYTDFSAFQYRKFIPGGTGAGKDARYYTAAGKKSGTQGVWEGRTGKADGNAIFHPKYNNNGKICSYYYDENYSSNRGVLTLGIHRDGWKDYRMYHIQITSTSEDYVLARPKLDEAGHTAAGEDNAKRVSPSFMINSQLGATSGDVALYTNGAVALQWANSFAENYAEVYEDKDGNLRVYDDWRLPTPAELKIIRRFQGTKNSPSESMYEVMNGAGYWTSNGHYSVSISGNEHYDQSSPYFGESQNCCRLVRDVYDEDNVEGKLVDEYFRALSSYTKYDKDTDGFEDATGN